MDGFDKVEFCGSFEYLGAEISNKQGCVSEVSRRLDKARKAFWKLANHIWDVPQISLQVKLRVYRSCVLSVLLYGAEFWTTIWECRKKLEKFHMRCFSRKIANITHWDQERWHLNNEAIRSLLGTPTIVQIISQARLRWLGHLARMTNTRLPKQMLVCFISGEVGVPAMVGRRSGKWVSYDYVNDLAQAGVPLHAWMTIARANAGSDWRKYVFKLAPWFAPKQIHKHAIVPEAARTASNVPAKHQPKFPFLQKKWHNS